jgi:hypothetical protein
MMEECFPFSLCAQTARNVGKKAPLFTLGNRHTQRAPKRKRRVIQINGNWTIKNTETETQEACQWTWWCHRI